MVDGSNLVDALVSEGALVKTLTLGVYPESGDSQSLGVYKLDVRR